MESGTFLSVRSQLRNESKISAGTGTELVTLASLTRFLGSLCLPRRLFFVEIRLVIHAGDGAIVVADSGDGNARVSVVSNSQP